MEIPAGKPHVALCPSAGMGHLAPILRLAAALSSTPYNCKVTLVVITPIITAAESDHISSFFSSHPHIHRLDFHVHFSPSAASGDPFILRYDSISRSAHLLAASLSSVSPPLSAVFSDLLFTKGLNTTSLLPNYTLITTSARFFCFMAYLPHFLKSLPSPEYPALIPGFAPFPSGDIPPLLFNPDQIFTNTIVTNAEYFNLSKGILLNTFHSFEPETLTALSSGKALPDLPPVITIGPHRSLVGDSSNDPEVASWLDGQPEKSVIYVSFGSRTALSNEQIRELGLGLEKSGCRFLWVVKSSMVDKEDNEGLEDLLGKELCERLTLGGRGKVVKIWVKQEEVLGHRAVGGFMSHCGWNSVVEAAEAGVAVLAWPQHGDQRANAGVVEKAGLGVWERGWGSGTGGGKVVEAAEIAEKVRVVMGKAALRRKATKVGEEARKACDDGGSSALNLMGIVESLKHCN